MACRATLALRAEIYLANAKATKAAQDGLLRRTVRHRIAKPHGGCRVRARPPGRPKRERIEKK
jgi:hypothetical protein